LRCGGPLAAGSGLGDGRDPAGTICGSDFGWGAVAVLAVISGLGGAIALAALGGAASQEATSIKTTAKANPTVKNPDLATRPSIPSGRGISSPRQRMENLRHLGRAGQLVLKGW